MCQVYNIVTTMAMKNKIPNISYILKGGGVLTPPKISIMRSGLQISCERKRYIVYRFYYYYTLL